MFIYSYHTKNVVRYWIFRRNIDDTRLCVCVCVCVCVERERDRELNALTKPRSINLCLEQVFKTEGVEQRKRF
jgi:hypothetical protein